MEQRRSGLVITRGFLFIFIIVTALAFGGGFLWSFLRGGGAIFALPLLAWSPFLLLIGLHMGLTAATRFRVVGRRAIADAFLAIVFIGFSVSVACLAIRIFRL